MLKRNSSFFLILALWCFATFWNWDKAFHIDDPAHMDFAQWIASHPLHPMSGIIFGDGHHYPIYSTNQPSLYFYLMALWGKMWGWSEISMHSLVSIFTLWALVCFKKLSQLCCKGSQNLAVCLMALCPAFVVGQNTMVDVPLLAMILAFYWTLLSPQYSNSQRYILAGILCSIALLTKYASLVLIPAIALHMLLSNNKRYWVYLFIPVGTLIAWSFFNITDFGHPHILGRGAGNHWRWGQLRLIFWWLGILGAICPFAIVFFIAKYRQAASKSAKAWWLFFTTSSAISPLLIALCLILKPNGHLIDLIFNYAFLASGLGLFVLLFFAVTQITKLLSLHEKIQGLMLMYWIISVSVFMIGLAPFLAIRHALLIIPPLLLLLLSSEFTKSLTRPLAALAICLSISITSLLALADNWFAGIYRQEASVIAKDLYRDLNSDNHIWYTGIWGWAWYANQAGLTPLDFDRPAVKPGDLVIISKYGSQPNVSGWVLKQSIEFAPNRWYEYFASTGLYQSDMRPWQFRTTPIDILKVYRVEK